jgi:hypothetical protein
MSKADRAILEKLDRILYYLTALRTACSMAQQADWETYYNAATDVRNCRRLVAEDDRPRFQEPHHPRGWAEPPMNTVC